MGTDAGVKAAGGHARLQQHAVLEKVLILGGEHIGIRGVPLRGGNRVERVQPRMRGKEGIHQETYGKIVILRQVHLHFGKVAGAPYAGNGRRWRAARYKSVESYSPSSASMNHALPVRMGPDAMARGVQLFTLKPLRS